MFATLSTFLTADPTALAFFQQLAPSYRRRYETWVAAAANPADQQLRLAHAQHELRAGHRVLKIGSYMGDVSLARNIVDAPALRRRLILNSEDATHQQLAQFACVLAEHVATAAVMRHDPALRAVIAINRQWCAGTATFQDARALATQMMAKYRAATAPQAKAFYRFCHQASLTPHVKRHALIAADFAMAIVTFDQAEPLVAARAERQWQLTALKTICAGN